MKATPLLFTAEMIRALLDGRKTQTRRIVKPRPQSDGAIFDPAIGWRFKGGPNMRCPYGQPGDLIWVKESWAQRLDHDHLNGTQLYAAGIRNAGYWADGPAKCCNTGCAGAAGRVRAARFMPRWASRLTLELTDVRVQRVQDISDADAVAEGCQETHLHAGTYSTAYSEFSTLWDRINAKRGYSWDSNPWVWALTFKAHKVNVDQMKVKEAA